MANANALLANYRSESKSRYLAEVRGTVIESQLGRTHAYMEDK